MNTNFNNIEVKFRIFRKDKIEPELHIDIIIFKGIDNYPIEIFDKSSLTETEKLMFKFLEEERVNIYKRFTKNLNNNKQLFVNFITNVEETPHLFYRTREVALFSKEEFEDHLTYPAKKNYIIRNLKDAFQNLIRNAKISGQEVKR